MGKVERKVAILEVLSEANEPIRPSDIGEIIGETALQTGNLLTSMVKSGLAEKPDKKKSFYEITEKGRGYLENPPDEVEGEEPKLSAEAKPASEVQELSADNIADQTTVAIPSQADLFRDIGARLRIGIGRGGRQEGTPLDAIIYYVQRTADLDNLTSVWNALTEMGVANDVKKRWIKLYAQNLPGKEIPEELKEKLEGGLEAEKVKVETGDVPPKPKRFSVVNNAIIGDSEGDLSFKEALQYVAQQRGASPAEAESLALQLSKQGPEMLTSIMGVITPLINKEPPKTDNTMIQVLQQRIEQLADDKHKAEMDSLRAEMKSGQRSPEADQQIQTLSQQITDLRDTLHNQELAQIQAQNQALIGALNAKLSKLEEQITAGIQGKQAESKIGLMSKTLDVLAEEAKGARQDLKSMAPTFLSRGAPTRKRTSDEKAGFGTGLDKGIGKARAARALEEELFFSGQAEG